MTGAATAAPLNFERILRLSDRIVREFEPERVILFGSYAYGVPRSDSDVDLLVVLDYEGDEVELEREMLRRLEPEFFLQLFAKRRTDLERRYREYDPIAREALDLSAWTYDPEELEWLSLAAVLFRYPCRAATRDEARLALDIASELRGKASLLDELR